MADFDNRFDREDGIRTMDALDKLLKDIPSDYDEVDVANHLLHFREQAKAELSALRERAEKAEAERDFYRRQFPTAAKNWQKVTQAGDA